MLFLRQTKANKTKTMMEDLRLIFTAISVAFFAWFFNYCAYAVPYLKWYGKLLDKLPTYLSDPLGRCPFCMAPWLILLVIYVPIPSQIIQIAGAFGWAYAASCIFSRYFDESDPTI